MPKITIVLADKDIKFLNQLALREGRSRANTTQMLITMSLEMIRTGKLSGLCNQSIPLIPPDSKQESKFKQADWTKEERDKWIMTGHEPTRVPAL
jgi:hypothetical protein